MYKTYIAKNIIHSVGYLKLQGYIGEKMKNSSWKMVDKLPDQYIQLEFFPPTPTEVLLGRVLELEQKLERQRKSQFGKIGRQEKRLYDLEERFKWMEKAVCSNNKNDENSSIENTCEILEMVVS